MDQDLLCKKVRWIRNLHILLLVKRESVFRAELYTPRRDHENVYIAELLRRNPSDLASGLPLSPTIIFTTNKRREKLRVESFLCTQVIMSRGGMIVPQEFLLKARSEQSISDALSFDIDL